MKDIDVIVYNDILKRRQQEKNLENRIHLEVPDYFENSINEKKKIEKKEPRRVIIIDL